MEEMSFVVAVPLRVGNCCSVCDNPTIVPHMDVSRFELKADTGLLSNSVTKVFTKTVAGSDDCDDSGNLEDEAGIAEVIPPKQDREGASPMLDMISQNGSTLVAGDEVLADEIEDDSLSLEGDQVVDSSCSLSAVSENSSVCGEDSFCFDAISDVGTPCSAYVDKSIGAVNIVAEAVDLGESNVDTDITAEPLAVAVSLEEENGIRTGPKPSNVVLHQLPQEKGGSGMVGRSVFELDYTPLYGYLSVCGRRPEMEDALATVPRFLKIPIQMLIGDRVLDGINKCFNQQMTHFFGVYDGHGGSQVKFNLIFIVMILASNDFSFICNTLHLVHDFLIQVAKYCQDRIHKALAEEIEFFKETLISGSMKDGCQDQWKKAFTNCFLKVDAEVGGKVDNEPVAPETVGSTAVVAVICSSHIIVANCGDSRAVLCRGKEPMALSEDHKVTYPICSYISPLIF